MNENEKKLREVLAKATEAPWQSYGQHGYFDVIAGDGGSVVTADARGDVNAANDIVFIALARNTLPGILAELDRLRAIEAAAVRWRNSRCQPEPLCCEKHADGCETDAALCDLIDTLQGGP